MSPVGEIRPDATAEEVAAITAAVAVLEEERRLAAQAAAAASSGSRSMWVDASRRASQRAGLQRGPWRLSGRIPRRSRT